MPETRVLLVEDNAINQKVVTRMLERIGCRVDVAPDGDVGVDMAHGAYALVLMDCSMPRMDGFEATRRIRRLPPPRSAVPIVALTAHATSADRERCLAAGMDDWVAKPVTPEDLTELLKRHTSWRVGEPPALVEGILDLDTVRTLAALGGDEDPDFLRSLVADFRGAAEGGLQEARAHLVRGGFDPLRRTVHRLKSACATLGAVRLREACGRIELADEVELRADGQRWLDVADRELALALAALAAIPGVSP